jgi:hypothetical protein
LEIQLAEFFFEGHGSEERVDPPFQRWTLRAGRSGGKEAQGGW